MEVIIRLSAASEIPKLLSRKKRSWRNIYTVSLPDQIGMEKTKEYEEDDEEMHENQ